MGSSDPEMHELNTAYLDKAYRLAYFINPNEEFALLIAKRALAKLEVTSNAQFKRYYYQPTGRSGKSSSKTHRSRVAWEEPHLLQRLLYAESDAIEKEQENSGDASLLQEDMAVRFIKYLVKVTLRRNSFYVTLGVSRLLHNFSTTETMDLFAILIQDPERVRDDFYYRSRKKKLMEECRERFGKLLNIVRGYRGEQRFEEIENTPSLTELVKTCLRQFTPWDTSCVLTREPDPHTWRIPGFSFDGEDPDEEHDIEINRIHSVIHPDCFHHLTNSLKLGPPEERLSVPLFNLTKDNAPEPPAPNHRLKPPELDEAHHRSVKRFLHEQGNRRKDVKADILLVKADGSEIARFDPRISASLHCQIDEGAEMIEVYSSGGVLLAVHLLTSPAPDQEEAVQESAVLLEAGQEISFKILCRVEKNSEHFEAEIGYRETRWSRAASLFGSRLAAQIRGALDLGAAPGRRLVPILATGLVVFLAAFLLLRQPVDSTSPTPPGPEIIVEQPGPGLDRDGAVDKTRGPAAIQTGLSLAAIQHIYIDPLGEDPFSDKLRLAIIERIKTSARFSVSPARDSADAVLKDVSEFEDRQSETTISLSLVNVEGQELWKAAIDVADRTGANPETLAVALVQRLLNAAQNGK